MDFMDNSWSEAWCATLLPAHLPIDLPFPKDLYILYVVGFPLLFQPVFHPLNLLQAVPTANKCQWLLRSPIISLKWSKVFLQKPASQWKICICAYSASFKGWPTLPEAICTGFLQMQQLCPRSICWDIFHPKHILLLATSGSLCFSDFLLISSAHSCYCMFL